MRSGLLWTALAVGCGPASSPTNLDPLVQGPGDLPIGPEMSQVAVHDAGEESGYQDAWFGTFKRGRGNIVADFDGDGDWDVFSGNPGNESFLIRNLTAPGGPLQFEAWQLLSDQELFYGGVAADFDNDGDPDLAVATGANDGVEFDRFYWNELDRGAPASEPLVDASVEMSLAPVDPLMGYPVPNGTMGMRAFDVNDDGRLDLFASNEIRNKDDLLALDPTDVTSLNQLYVQDEDGMLIDRAIPLGIAQQAGSRHASVFDYDRDGDMDLFDNAFTGESVFWENTLAQTGQLGFVDVTEAVVLDGTSLRNPYEQQSMCSISVDLDNDGWEDLLVLHRGVDDPLPAGAVFGHSVWMNVGGEGFVDVGRYTRINRGWMDHPEAEVDNVMPWWGVMGCQVGDVDLDGYPDLFLGMGSGGAGEVNRLFVMDGLIEVEVAGHVVHAPIFEDWTPKIDFPPESGQAGILLDYPLRTHGSAFVDFDGDGVSELSVHNGGPAAREFEEPNRLYTFDLPDPRFLRVRLYGDGMAVNRDGIDSRVRVVVERDRDGGQWELWKTRRAGTGFGAENEGELVFGLGDGDRVVEIEVFWPDGTVMQVDPPEGPRNWLRVDYE